MRLDRIAALAAAGKLTPAQLARAAERGWVDVDDVDPSAVTAQALVSGNEADLKTRLRGWIDTNKTYLALVAPTAAERNTQLDRLTREATALTRLMLRDLTDTTGS